MPGYGEVELITDLVNRCFRYDSTDGEIDSLREELADQDVSGIHLILDELADRNSFGGFTDTTPVTREALLDIYSFALEQNITVEHEQKLADMLAWDVFTEGWEDRTLIAKAIELVGTIGTHYSIDKLQELKTRIHLIKYPLESTFADHDLRAIEYAIAKCRARIPSFEDAILNLYTCSEFETTIESRKALGIIKKFRVSAWFAASHDEDVASTILSFFEKQRVGGVLANNPLQVNCFLLLFDVLEEHARLSHAPMIENIFSWNVWHRASNGKLRNRLITFVKERGDTPMSYALESLGKKLSALELGPTESTSVHIRNSLRIKITEAVRISRRKRREEAWRT